MDTVMIRSLAAAMLLSATVIGLSACAETWEGAKEDTKENVEATGESIEKAGDNIEKSVK